VNKRHSKINSQRIALFSLMKKEQFVKERKDWLFKENCFTSACVLGSTVGLNVSFAGSVLKCEFHIERCQNKRHYKLFHLKETDQEANST
jgi:hypothetical protein